MKTIEVVDIGGIYGYFDNNKCLYIGKTVRDFKQRDKEHRNSINKTPFEIFYYNNPKIEYKILFDCKICHLTTSQLDYLEKCFINSLKPEYNILGNIIDTNIKNINIEDINSKSKNKDILISTFTKNEILVFNFIKDKKIITRGEIRDKFKNNFSERTLDRIMNKFKKKELLILIDIDNTGKIFYKINEHYVGSK